MEFTPTQIVIPVVVSALVTMARQFTAGLDGPKAYWVSIVLNIVAQVVAQLSSDGGSVIAGAALGLGTGAVVGPGLATSVKRLGLEALIKPRRDSS